MGKPSDVSNPVAVSAKWVEEQARRFDRDVRDGVDTVTWRNPATSYSRLAALLNWCLEAQKALGAVVHDEEAGKWGPDVTTCLLAEACLAACPIEEASDAR